MAKRVGVIGIVIEDPNQVAEKVNAVISSHSYMLLGRMGVPRPEDNVGVIALIIEGTTDDVGSLTGKLGALPGVTVKSALTAKQISDKGDK